MSSHKAVSERFYRALYATLLSPALAKSSKVNRLRTYFFLCFMCASELHPPHLFGGVIWPATCDLIWLLQDCLWPGSSQLHYLFSWLLLLCRFVSLIDLALSGAVAECFPAPTPVVLVVYGPASFTSFLKISCCSIPWSSYVSPVTKCSKSFCRRLDLRRHTKQVMLVYLRSYFVR